MILHIINFKLLNNYKVWLEFNDGSKGSIDLYPHLIGPIFEELHNKKKFNEVTLDKETHTICWPNGADFAPEYLKAHLIK